MGERSGTFRDSVGPVYVAEGPPGAHRQRTVPVRAPHTEGGPHTGQLTLTQVNSPRDGTQVSVFQGLGRKRYELMLLELIVFFNIDKPS